LKYTRPPQNYQVLKKNRVRRCGRVKQPRIRVGRSIIYNDRSPTEFTTHRKLTAAEFSAGFWRSSFDFTTVLLFVHTTISRNRNPNPAHSPADTPLLFLQLRLIIKHTTGAHTYKTHVFTPRLKTVQTTAVFLWAKPDIPRDFTHLLPRPTLRTCDKRDETMSSAPVKSRVYYLLRRYFFNLCRFHRRGTQKGFFSVYGPHRERLEHNDNTLCNNNNCPDSLISRDDRFVYAAVHIRDTVLGTIQFNIIWVISSAPRVAPTKRIRKTLPFSSREYLENVIHIEREREDLQVAVKTL